ncbi:hypothetical protein F53441_11970 [Fusarium austroafricanum]|uniref:Uncharacterized protein n=1 Tax=Fusarium austroafricanum TaxID=2364996 RepID=A0A8H4K0V0_9HYPO|nr:hypothetical protein F53441_11970 [Fusarium austroafricanum]
MAAFETLSKELSALLSQHFQVIATNTQRQDQWYKRSYESFTQSFPDRKPYIVVPRESRDEWVPLVRRFATKLANEIGEAADKRSNEVEASLTSGTKVFSAQVLDKAHDMPLCFGTTGVEKPLSPDMMQMSWWTNKRQHPDDKARRLKGIKALIACGEIAPLLRLVTWPQTRKQQEPDIDASQWVSLNNGWQNSVDSILLIMLFLGALDAFPEPFFEEYPLQRGGFWFWVPIAFYNYRSIPRLYAQAHGSQVPRTTEEIRKEMALCFEALIAAQTWSLKGGYKAIDWEDRIMHNFLYLLGFEAWNRNREGESYLGCDLNTTKTTGSLRTIGQEDDGEEQKDDSGSQGIKKKPMDPLKLREPKEQVAPELDEEKQQKLEELALIESYEKEYGRKRSTKYMSKHKSDI